MLFFKIIFAGKYAGVVECVMSDTQKMFGGWQLATQFSERRYPLLDDPVPEGFEVLMMPLDDVQMYVRDLARHRFGAKLTPASWGQSLQFVRNNPQAQRDYFLYAVGAYRASLIQGIGEMPVFTVCAGVPCLHLVKDPELVGGPRARVLILDEKLEFPPM